jgi:hypothetical protein
MCTELFSRAGLKKRNKLASQADCHPGMEPPVFEEGQERR